LFRAALSNRPKKSPFAFRGFGVSMVFPWGVVPPRTREAESAFVPLRDAFPRNSQEQDAAEHHDPTKHGREWGAVLFRAHCPEGGDVENGAVSTVADPSRYEYEHSEEDEQKAEEPDSIFQTSPGAVHTTRRP
jgi:hypothetical protein